MPESVRTGRTSKRSACWPRWGCRPRKRWPPAPRWPRTCSTMNASATSARADWLTSSSSTGTCARLMCGGSKTGWLRSTSAANSSDPRRRSQAPALLSEARLTSYGVGLVPRRTRTRAVRDRSNERKGASDESTELVIPDRCHLAHPLRHHPRPRRRNLPAGQIGTHRDPQDRTRRSDDVRAEVPEGRSDDRTLWGASDRGELPHDRNPDGAQPRRRHDRDELSPLPAGPGRRRGDVGDDLLDGR